MTLLVSVDSENTTDPDTYFKDPNLTAENLAKYENESNSSFSFLQNISSHESGEQLELLDLDGAIREKLLYEVATAADEQVSVICSPLSAMMPLGILLYGAGNEETEKEILKSCGIRDKSEARNYFKDLRKKILSLPGATTLIVSKIFLSQLLEDIVEAFEHDADATFGEGCTEVVELSEPTDAAATVNKWVREYTDGKITEIMTRYDLRADTMIVAVDAIYFSAQWEYRFVHTQSETFYGIDGRHTIQIMKAQNEYSYGTSNTLEAQAILIPYREGAANMLVLLPHERYELRSLLDKLKKEPKLINEIKMKKTWVELHMPKFKIETLLDLAVYFEEVGLKEIFGRGFDKVSDNEYNFNLTFTKGLQKAMIDVNEIGTTVAAPSDIEDVGAGNLTHHVDLIFRVDHQFLFIIIAHKQQLFGGIFLG